MREVIFGLILIFVNIIRDFLSSRLTSSALQKNLIQENPTEVKCLGWERNPKGQLLPRVVNMKV